MIIDETIIPLESEKNSTKNLPVLTLMTFWTQRVVMPFVTSLVPNTYPWDDQYAAVPFPSGCELFHYWKSFLSFISSIVAYMKKVNNSKLDKSWQCSACILPTWLIFCQTLFRGRTVHLLKNKKTILLRVNPSRTVQRNRLCSAGHISVHKRSKSQLGE